MPALQKCSKLTLEGAQTTLEASIAHARELGVAVTVAVTDAGGHMLALGRMDGAPAFSLTVATKKAWTAATTGVPTSMMSGLFNSDPVLLHALAPKVDQLLAVGGGATVMSEGAVAGAVGVSGATEEQDQAIADAGAGAIEGGTP